MVEKLENTELIKHTPVEGTPFHITGNEETGYFLRIGKYRLTDNFKTEDEVQDELFNGQWYITCNLIAVIMEAEKNISKTN